MYTSSLNRGLFGRSLKELNASTDQEVPGIVAECLRWLAQHGLATPGIWEGLGPNSNRSLKSATLELKHAFETGARRPLRSSTDPRAVAGLLKRWLESLPDPLLSWNTQVDCLSCMAIVDRSERTVALREVISENVDVLTLGTLKPLLLFLQQYCYRQKQQFDQQLEQVSKAFVGVLFPAALAAGPNELRMAEDVTAVMVSNALHIFSAGMPTKASAAPAACTEQQLEPNPYRGQPGALIAAGEGHAEVHISITPRFTDGELQQGAWPANGKSLVQVSAAPEQQVWGREPAAHEALGRPLGTVVRPNVTQPDPYAHPPRSSPRSEGQEKGDAAVEVDPCLLEPEFLSRLDMLVANSVCDCLFSPDHSCELPTFTCPLSPGKGWSGGVGADNVSRARAAVELHLGPGAADGAGVICVVSASGTDAWAAPAVGAVGGVDGASKPRALALAQSPRESGMNGQQLSPLRFSMSWPANGPSTAHMHQAADGSSGVHLDHPYSPSAPLLAPTLSASPTLQSARQALREADRLLSVSSGSASSSSLALGQLCLSTSLTSSCSTALEAMEDAEAEAEMRRFQSACSSGGSSATSGSLGGASSISTSSGGMSHRRSTEGGANGCPQQHAPAAVSHQPQSREQSFGGFSPAMSQLHSQQHPSSAIQRRVSLGGSQGGAGMPPSALAQPPAAAAITPASPSPLQAAATSSGPCLHATLGQVGNVMVGLKGARLMVWDLPHNAPTRTPHLPVRELSLDRAMGEKEVLKRQLKHITSSYESYCGRPLTVEEKEVLRPCYVRYHKLKAFISKASGAAHAPAPAPAPVPMAPPSAAHHQLAAAVLQGLAAH